MFVRCGCVGTLLTEDARADFFAAWSIGEVADDRAEEADMGEADAGVGMGLVSASGGEAADMLVRVRLGTVF